MHKKHSGALCPVWKQNKTRIVLNFLGFSGSFEVCWGWGKSVLFLPPPFPSAGCWWDEEGPFPCSAHPELPCRGSSETSTGLGSGCCGLQEGPKISEPWDNPPITGDERLREGKELFCERKCDAFWELSLGNKWCFCSIKMFPRSLL